MFMYRLEKSPSAICVRDLHYSYSSRSVARRDKGPIASGPSEVLKGLNFDVSFGKITGLLGPNGSGKSTAFKILSTQLIAPTGHVEICGLQVRQEPEKVRSVLGVTFQSPSLDPVLSVLENLEIHAALMGLNTKESSERIDKRLSQLGLADRAHTRVSELSGGLARRAELAKTLLNEPKVLLLDEPTTGLDPASRRDFWKILRDFVSPERAIFVTTHLMEEAELCDELIFISEGLISGAGSPSELKNEFEKDVVFLESDQLEKLRELLVKELHDNESCQMLSHGLRVETLRARELLAMVQDKWIGILKGFSWSRGTLSDVYFNKTGKVLES